MSLEPQAKKQKFNHDTLTTFAKSEKEKERKEDLDYKNRRIRVNNAFVESFRSVIADKFENFDIVDNFNLQIHVPYKTEGRLTTPDFDDIVQKETIFWLRSLGWNEIEIASDNKLEITESFGIESFKIEIDDDYVGSYTLVQTDRDQICTIVYSFDFSEWLKENK